MVIGSLGAIRGAKRRLWGRTTSNENEDGMKTTGLVASAVLFSATLMGLPAMGKPPGQQPCPDTCTIPTGATAGTCSNNANVKCSADATCVTAAIDAACPCDTASNHGQHQSCVVHLRNTLRKDGCP